jgi:hypothetical protein
MVHPRQPAQRWLEAHGYREVEWKRFHPGETQGWVKMVRVAGDDCGGEGGFCSLEGYAGDQPIEHWDECPTCHGSGWLTNHEPAPEIEQDELPPPLPVSDGEP